MAFESYLQIKESDDENMFWALTEPLIYRGNKETFTAPVGFITNFASVPRVFWSILAPWGRHMKAAVIHDLLYRTQAVSRLDADKLFLRTMKELGVSWWRRYTMYRAVRLFGGKHYRA